MANEIENVSFEELTEEARQALNVDNPLTLINQVYQLWWRWADFGLYIISPTIETITPPLLLLPEPIPGTENYEFV